MTFVTLCIGCTHTHTRAQDISTRTHTHAHISASRKRLSGQRLMYDCILGVESCKVSYQQHRDYDEAITQPICLPLVIQRIAHTSPALPIYPAVILTSQNAKSFAAQAYTTQARHITHTPSESSPPPTLNVLSFTPTHSHQYTHTHTPIHMPNLRHQEVAFFLCLEFPLPLVQILHSVTVCVRVPSHASYTQNSPLRVVFVESALCALSPSALSAVRNETSRVRTMAEVELGTAVLGSHYIRTPRRQRK